MGKSLFYLTVVFFAVFGIASIIVCDAFGLLHGLVLFIGATSGMLISEWLHPFEDD